MTVEYEDMMATPVFGESSSGGPKRIAVDDDGKLKFSPDGKVGHVYTAIGSGRKTVSVAGTRERLVDESTPAKLVIITALAGNGGTTTTGSDAVVSALLNRAGGPLLPGKSTYMLVDDLLDVYLDVTVAGDGVSYTFLN
jgi:hypothetical protein